VGIADRVSTRALDNRAARRKFVASFLAGRVVRLSATLVDADFVIRRSHRGVYLYDSQTWVRDIEAFTTEFEAVAGVDLPWTLLPAP
jgi:hypothetical protein